MSAAQEIREEGNNAAEGATGSASAPDLKIPSKGYEEIPGKAFAIQSDGPLETTTLFDHSAQVDQIFGAFAVAQGEVEQPGKTKKAVVETKNGGKYVYWYCDIADVLRALQKPFAAQGLAVFQMSPDIKEREYEVHLENKTIKRIGAKVEIRTVISHKSGQWLSNTIWAMAEGTGPQALGSVITYLRRYGLQLLAGVAADEDEDGEAAQGDQPGGAANKPGEPQRGAPNGQEIEVFGPVGDSVVKNVSGGESYEFSINGQGPGGKMSVKASTRDARLYRDLKAEAREGGMYFYFKIRRAKTGNWWDLVGAEAEPARKARTEDPKP